MRLRMERDGCRRTIRSPHTGTMYEFRENTRVVDVEDEADIAYILGVHGDVIQPELPMADGWAVYNGDEPEVCMHLATGDITLQQNVPARIALVQQRELEMQLHWPPIAPALTYLHGMKRLLVTRDMGLGDMLMLGAALRALRGVCPDIEIVLSTTSGWVPLLQDQPGIDSVILMGTEPDAGQFDQHINLVYWVETAQTRLTRHRTDVFGEALGLDEVPDKSVIVPLTKDERRSAQAELNGAGRPLVGVAYRGSTNARSYPMDQITGLCHEITGRGMGVALIDHGPQPHVALPEGALRLCGTQGARELAGVVSALDCVVSTDTGLVHLAAAVGTPCVAVASSIPPEMRWSAYENMHVIDTAKRVNCDYCHDGPSCRPGDVGSGSLTDWAPPCLRSLPPDELADVVAEVVG